MKIKYIILLTVAPAVLVLDQFTKFSVLEWLDTDVRIPIINGYFDLVHFRNTGAAFGMFSEMADRIRIPFFYVVAVTAVVLLGFLYRSLKDEERLMPVALSLIFGGIAGNIIDRVRLGSVVDFLSVHIRDRMVHTMVFGRPVHFQLEWPAFNIADSAITAAMILLIYSALFSSIKKG